MQRLIARSRPCGRVLAATLCALLATGAAAAPADPDPAGDAPIYKVDGPDGTPTFTDDPGERPAERVDLEPIMVVDSVDDPEDGAPAAAGNGTEGVTDEDEADADAVVEEPDYVAIRVIRPQANETIRRNGGNLDILAQAMPGLPADASFEFFVDGEYAGSSTDGSLLVDSLSRGPHTILVQAVADEGVIGRSPPVEFMLLRAAVGGS